MSCHFAVVASRRLAVCGCLSAVSWVMYSHEPTLNDVVVIQHWLTSVTSVALPVTTRHYHTTRRKTIMPVRCPWHKPVISAASSVPAVPSRTSPQLCTETPQQVPSAHCGDYWLNLTWLMHSRLDPAMMCTDWSVGIYQSATHI